MFNLSKWSKRAGFAVLTVFAVLIASVFTPAPALAATAPSLGTAASFAVLGGSTVTNTDSPTVITGDLGVYAGTSITGFPPGNCTGTQYSGGAVAQQAQSDVTTAYNALVGQSCDFVTIAPTDLGGMTLTPGVYCYSLSVG